MARSRPVAASQIRTVPSRLPEASQLPSGATATAATALGVAGQGGPLPAGGRIPDPHRPVPPPEASQLPSGATATAVTPPVWPVKDGPLLPGGRVPDPHRPVPAAGGQPAAIRRHRHRRPPRRCGRSGSARSRPVAASQIRTVPSRPPEASQLPSGATATAATVPVWPVRAARSRPVARPRSAPSRPRCRRPASCRPAPPPPPPPCRCGRSGRPVAARWRVPDPHRPVAAAGGQPAAIRRHRHRRHPVRVWPFRAARSRRWPRPRSAPSRPSRRRPASCHPAPPPPPSPPPAVAGQGGPLPPGGRIPDPHRPVIAAGGEPAAVRRHRHRPPRRCGRPARAGAPGQPGPAAASG